MAEDAIRRAALVVANLDRAAADAILDRLPEQQALAIRDEILALSDADFGEQEGVLRAFLHPPQSDQLEQSTRQGPPSIATRHGPEVSPSMQDFLVLDDEVIATALMHERSSVIAGVLASVPGNRAANVLRLLADTTQTRVMLLLSHGISPKAAVIDMLVDAICNRFDECAHRPVPGMRHHDALQSILEAMGPQERFEMLRSLSAENPLLARRLAESDTSNSSSDCYC